GPRLRTARAETNPSTSGRTLMTAYDHAQFTLCSSSRFYAEVERIANALRARGALVHTPRLDMNEELVTVDESAKHTLTTDFLQKVAVSQAIFIVNPGGYVGMSVAVESGFAYARSIPIYALDNPREPAVAALITAIRR